MIMKNNRKKIALILVLALTLAIAIPALAAQTTRVVGKYEVPAIEVIIPTSGQAVINPYKLPIKIMADDQSTIGNLKNAGQIATRPLVGVNLSEVDLDIGATVVGEATGDFILTAEAPANTVKTKSGQVYLDLANANYDLGYDTTIAGSSTAVCGGFNATAVMSALEGWTEADYNKDSPATNHLLVSARADSKQHMVTIKAMTDSDSDGAVDTIPSDGYFMARLIGKVTVMPTEEWTVRDGVNTTITWIIEPTPAANPGP